MYVDWFSRVTVVVFTMCFCHVVCFSVSAIKRCYLRLHGVSESVICLPKHYKGGVEDVTSRLELILNYDGGIFDW